MSLVDDYDGWTDKSDQWKRKPVRWCFRKYDHAEHLKWSAFFDILRIRHQYQPQHFGLSVDVGLRPTFHLEGGYGWFVSVHRMPTERTRFAAQAIAQQTGEQVIIAIGPIQPPMVSQAVPTNLLWVTGGHGHALWRVWGGRVPRVRLFPVDAHHDARTPDVIQAYEFALRVKGLAVRA